MKLFSINKNLISDMQASNRHVESKKEGVKCRANTMTKIKIIMQ